jgi:hypothetical protein
MQKTFWLDSTTVRAALLGFVPAAYTILKAFGLDLPEGVLENIVEGIAAVLTVISLVYVLKGRFNPEVMPLTTDSSEAYTAPPTG